MNIALADCNIHLNSSFSNRPKCYYFCDNTTADKQTRKCNHRRLHASLNAALKSRSLYCVFVSNISKHRKYMIQFKLKTSDIGETESDDRLYSTARNAAR